MNIDLRGLMNRDHMDDVIVCGNIANPEIILIAGQKGGGGEAVVTGMKPNCHIIIEIAPNQPTQAFGVLGICVTGDDVQILDWGCR